MKYSKNKPFRIRYRVTLNYLLIKRDNKALSLTFLNVTQIVNFKKDLRLFDQNKMNMLS